MSIAEADDAAPTEPEAAPEAERVRRLDRRRKRWGCLIYSLLAVLLPIATALAVLLVLEAIGNARAAEQRDRALAAGDPLSTEAMQAKFYPDSAEIDETVGHWNRAIESRKRVTSRDPQIPQVPYWNAYQTLQPGVDGFYDEATLARMDEFLGLDGEAAIEAAHAARRAGAVARFPSDVPTDRPVIGGSSAFDSQGDALQDLRSLQTLLTIDLERNAARGNVEKAVEDVLSSVAISEAYSLAPTELAAAYQGIVFGIAYANARGLIQRVDLSDDQLRRVEEAFSRQDFHAQLIALVQAEQYRAVRALETKEQTYDEVLDFLRSVPFRGADEAEALELFQDFLDDAKVDFEGVRRADGRLRLRLAEYEDLSFVQLLPHGVTIMTTGLVPGCVQRTFDRQAQQAFLQAGVACERYRIANGRWPENLEALVPEFLSEVPADPFDGEAIRYRVRGDRMELFSAGYVEERQDGVDFDKSPLTFVIEKPNR